MAERISNRIKTFLRWLFRILTLQAFWKKPNPNGSINYLSSSVSAPIAGTAPGPQSIPVTFIQDYVSEPPDPINTATHYASHMNRDVNRCENFYDFACGRFPAANPIPPWYNAVAATDFRVQEINKKILAYFDTNGAQGLPIFQKIRAFYMGCMDDVAIQLSGMETIAVELGMVGFPPDPTFVYKIKWMTYKYIDKLARLHRLTPLVDFLFDVSVQVDPVKMQVNQIFFGNTPATTHAGANVATEGLYSFAKFSNVFHATTAPDGQRYQAVRLALKMYITKVVNYMDTQTGIVGKEKFSSQFLPETIEKMTTFFLELEKTRQEGKHNRVENILRTRVSKMQAEVNMMDNFGYVGITWTKYFEMLFADLYDPNSGYFSKHDPQVLVQDLTQFRQTLRVFHKTKKDVLVLAMWFVVVHSVAPLGPKPIQDYHKEYLSAVYGGIDSTPRQLRCLNLIRTHFGYFVGHIMAKDKRSNQEQMKAIEMVDNIKSSLLDAIQQSTWIDPTTKAGAKTKLDSVTPYVSVWETLRNPNMLQQFYGNTFELGPSFAATYTNMLRRQRAQMLQTLFIRNDFQKKPYPNPASIYSRYYPSFVHLTVPVGALGPPFYDLGMEAFNYGALAVLITRELWHALDVSGQNYDQHGDKYPWWMPPTRQEYDKREAGLNHFYGSIRLQDLGINVDGVHTAIENVADLVGFEVGLRAYRKYTKKYGPEKNLDGLRDFTHEQWFTLAFANMHCIHASLEYIYGQATEDEYPPQSVRVNGVTMNSKEFANIWGCPPKPTIFL